VALGQTLLELANFAAAALVFGQFVGERLLSWELVVAGAGFWPVLVWLGLVAGGE
jgi:hypothetical protein